MSDELSEGKNGNELANNIMSVFSSARCIVHCDGLETDKPRTGGLEGDQDASQALASVIDSGSDNRGTSLDTVKYHSTFSKQYKLVADAAARVRGLYVSVCCNHVTVASELKRLKSVTGIAERKNRNNERKERRGGGHGFTVPSRLCQGHLSPCWSHHFLGATPRYFCLRCAASEANDDKQEELWHSLLRSVESVSREKVSVQTRGLLDMIHLRYKTG
ncbi:hypothetical protein ElyMa_002988900 [Elysia marginata]|uniref:Uncharacterized protein n=1 Tax=Elysia marginata TaxID=1093978 RepID=A0AAV4IAF1_9GAST|nr:hypothetical protein ElyMa_002988900 [Elysia marginata]